MTPPFWPGSWRTEFQATYRGPERSEYVRVLAVIVAGLGGSLQISPSDAAAVFDDRRVAIRFGSR